MGAVGAAETSGAMSGANAGGGAGSADAVSAGGPRTPLHTRGTDADRIGQEGDSPVTPMTSGDDDSMGAGGGGGGGGGGYHSGSSGSTARESEISGVVDKLEALAADLRARHIEFDP